MRSLVLRIPFTLALLVAALATVAGSQPVAAAPPITILEQADYVFACPDTNELLQCDPQDVLPDPAVWTANRIPSVDSSSWCVGGGDSVAQCAWMGGGLMLADSGSSMQLLYEYHPANLSGDTASPAHYNTAKFRVVSSAEYVNDGSSYWSAESTAWRMILDDGWHRLELKFARSTTGRRQVWVGNTAIAPFEFPWDSGLAHTYEIERHSNGDFTVTIWNADPAIPAQTRFIPGGMLGWTHGAPTVAWGTAWEGGSLASWNDVHFEVNKPSGTVSGKGSIDSPAGAMHDHPGATGQAKFSLNAKFAKGIPSGQVAFDFKAGNLAFKSSSIDALRVTETGTLIEGRGTVNGVGGYRFIVRVVDGQAAGGGGIDAFHIRIWDPATYTGHNATYDNEPLSDPWWHDATWPLSGGSITLR